MSDFYPPYDPNNQYSQPTAPGQYNQPPPPPIQPGQFGPPPQQQSVPDKLPWFDVKGRKAYFERHPEAKKKQALIGCGVLIGIFALCGICGAIANAGNSTNQPASVSQQPTSTHQPVILATMRVLTPTETPTPVPTPTETPTPTQAPVQSQPEQQQQPVQQQPATTGVYGNPWGYDFNPGSKIYNPNSGFCSYFSCVTTFWKDTSGYVVECGNGDFSHSGGISGVCSRDGGVQAILYQHP